MEDYQMFYLTAMVYFALAWKDNPRALDVTGAVIMIFAVILRFTQ